MLWAFVLSYISPFRFYRSIYIIIIHERNHLQQWPPLPLRRLLPSDVPTVPAVVASTGRPALRPFGSVCHPRHDVRAVARCPRCWSLHRSSGTPAGYGRRDGNFCGTVAGNGARPDYSRPSWQPANAPQMWTWPRTDDGGVVRHGPTARLGSIYKTIDGNLKHCERCVG